MVLGQPHRHVPQGFAVDAGRQPGRVAVDHGLVAALFDAAAEGPGDLGGLFPGQRVRAGGLAVDLLHVEGHGIIQLASVQNLQGQLRFGFRLFRRGGLGEKVGPHLQPGGFGPVQIGGGQLVFIQRAFAVAAVAQPHQGEFYAVGGDGLPVDLLLEIGHVHAQTGVGPVLVPVPGPLPFKDQLAPVVAVPLQLVVQQFEHVFPLMYVDHVVRQGQLQIFDAHPVVGGVVAQGLRIHVDQGGLLRGRTVPQLQVVAHGKKEANEQRQIEQQGDEQDFFLVVVGK